MDYIVAYGHHNGKEHCRGKRMRAMCAGSVELQKSGKRSSSVDFYYSFIATSSQWQLIIHHTYCSIRVMMSKALSARVVMQLRRENKNRSSRKREMNYIIAQRCNNALINLRGKISLIK